MKPMTDEYIRKQDALECVTYDVEYTTEQIKGLPSADVVPYSVSSDGTLTITIPKGMKVGRVLVEEDGTQWGGLFYAD